eukprot:179612-Amphidinium_carterae.1
MKAALFKRLAQMVKMRPSFICHVCERPVEYRKHAVQGAPTTLAATTAKDFLSQANYQLP